VTDPKVDPKILTVYGHEPRSSFWTFYQISQQPQRSNISTTPAIKYRNNPSDQISQQPLRFNSNLKHQKLYPTPKIFFK